MVMSLNRRVYELQVQFLEGFSKRKFLYSFNTKKKNHCGFRI